MKGTVKKGKKEMNVQEGKGKDKRAKNEGTTQITFPLRRNLPHHEIMGYPDILFLFIPLHEICYSLFHICPKLP
jgi:hypothetical protein